MKNLLLIVFIFTLLNILFTNFIKAESFTWPSDGYLGWRFYDDTHGYDLSGFKVNVNGVDHYYHTGVDIWSNSNGGWNNNIQGQSNAIYSAYKGQVLYVDPLGLQIKHRDGLYTNYWHVRSRQVNVGDQVDTTNILGYQDNAGGAVHVHLTVSTVPMQGSNHDNTGAIDPTTFLGIQLDVRQNNVAAFGYQVKHANGLICGVTNLTINYNILGNVDCNASNSITILPQSYLRGEQRYYIH